MLMNTSRYSIKILYLIDSFLNYSKKTNIILTKNVQSPRFLSVFPCNISIKINFKNKLLNATMTTPNLLPETTHYVEDPSKFSIRNCMCIPIYKKRIYISLLRLQESKNCYSFHS